jgi:hypothetical protein
MKNQKRTHSKHLIEIMYIKDSNRTMPTQINSDGESIIVEMFNEIQLIVEKIN